MSSGKRDFDQEPEEKPSLMALVQDLIFSEGWDRVFEVELLPSGMVLQVRKRMDVTDIQEFSEEDIVGLYSVEQYRRGELSRDAIRFDCRQFLRKLDVL